MAKVHNGCRAARPAHRCRTRAFRITHPEATTTMATMLQETDPAGLTTCCAAETLLDNVRAGKSRKKMCEYEPEEECICAEGEECWLV